MTIRPNMLNLDELRRLVQQGVAIDPGLVLALIDRVEQAEQAVDRKQQALDTVVKSLERQLEDVVKATESQDLIGEDLDGDWSTVWDRLHELADQKRKAEAANQRVEALCKNTDGEWLDSDFDGNSVGDIRRALDGGQA